MLTARPFTCLKAFNLSLTAEADYSSAGANREQWYALPVSARQQELIHAIVKAGPGGLPRKGAPV